ncbi:LIM and sh3 domain protein 1, partial [Plakobranchus ocellatus]
IWHKFCFKCEVCGMTLNMKNYKGYNKVPYCNAHYPTTKHTAVADTPEARRIAENTKIQSNDWRDLGLNSSRVPAVTIDSRMKILLARCL